MPAPRQSDVRQTDPGEEKSISRVGYKNKHVSDAIEALDDLEQTMGWNLRCAFLEDGGAVPGLATSALIQILEAAAKVRQHVALAEQEAIKVFRDETHRMGVDEATRDRARLFNELLATVKPPPADPASSPRSAEEAPASPRRRSHVPRRDHHRRRSRSRPADR
jgi:hypothetical protein